MAAFAASLAGLPELLRPGFYFQDDMQSQYVPLFEELGRSWARGELPLVTDSTWAGGAIAGEYQHGAFSLVHVCLALASHALRLNAVWLSLLLTTSYVAITAGGAYQLALHYRVSRALALSVALIAALNGFDIYFSSWLPALTRAAALVTLAPPLVAGTLLSAPALLCFLEYASASPRRDFSASSWM